MSSDSNELYYAEMEAARNSACDAYFEARPQIDRPDRRAAFNSGFERAFALVWHGGRAAQETGLQRCQACGYKVDECSCNKQCDCSTSNRRV